MQRQRIRKRNPWKIAFLTLISIVMIMWGIPSILFKNHVPTQSTTNQSTLSATDSSVMDVTLSKEMVQTLLNQAVENYSSQGTASLRFAIN